MGSLFPKKCPPSFLPSFPSFPLSVFHNFISFSSTPQRTQPLSLSLHFPFPRSHPTACLISVSLSLSRSLSLSSCHPRPPITSLRPFSSSPLPHSTLCVPLPSPLSLSIPLFPCIFNTHLYSILFSVVMAIGWGREGASTSKRAGVGVSEVTSLGQ